MKKLLETSDKIILIKLWGKFEENSQHFPTSHCLDNINMIQVVHQRSNFSSNFLYFFLNPNKRKKLTFFVMSFSSHFVHSTIFSTKFSKDQTEPKWNNEAPMKICFAFDSHILENLIKRKDEGKQIWRKKKVGRK